MRGRRRDCRRRPDPVFMARGPSVWSSRRAPRTSNRTDPICPHTSISWGDLAQGARDTSSLPEWWEGLDPERSVIHVSEGTLGRNRVSLVCLAVDALSDSGHQLVVSGQHHAGPLPEGVLTAPWISHDLL